MSHRSTMTDAECCAGVERDINKLLVCLGTVGAQTDSDMEGLISNLEELQHEVRALGNPPDTLQQMLLSSYSNKLKDAIKSISSQHKDLHASVSRIGKTIDKNFVFDFSSVAKDLHEEDKISMLNEVICDYFLRHGRLDVAETLIQEGELELTDEAKEPFLEMHQIVSDLNSHDLTSAFRWAEVNKAELSDLGSNLLFKLHKMKLLLMLSAGSSDCQTQALCYSRNLQNYCYEYIAEIREVMGCFLFQSRGLDNSPYAHLISNLAWDELIEIFSKDACSLLGLPQISPLAVSFEAGTKALAPLMHIASIMSQKNKQPIWGAKDELPVEIDVGRENRFHSIFACPILRQHTSDSNPPMRLVCGHVVSLDALHKLSNNQKLKCPYCPEEQRLSDARRLHL